MIHFTPRVHALIALSGVIMFVMAAAEAHKHILTGWNSSLLEAIYGWPYSLTPLFLIVTTLGSSWIAITAVVIAWLQRLHVLAIKLFVNGLVTFIAVRSIKLFIAQSRPAGLLDGINPRDPLASGYGFPSGHTTMVTVLGLTLLPYLPRRYYWTVPVAIGMVALSRIYLGVHSPLDVLGGMLLGLIIVSLQHTWTTTRLTRQSTKRVHKNIAKTA